MDLLEDIAMSQDADAKLAKYMASYPESVFTSKEDAMDQLRHDASDGSRFAWAIGRLPDGKFLIGFPKHMEIFGLPIVVQGSSDDF
jgi:hypothetical protein